MNPTDIERLRQFFGAYFHQDWADDDPNAAAVIARFISDHPDGKELASLAALVEDYARSRDEAGLEGSLVKELWCQYLPSADGLGARDWLVQVAQRLRATAAR